MRFSRWLNPQFAFARLRSSITAAKRVGISGKLVLTLCRASKVIALDFGVPLPQWRVSIKPRSLMHRVWLRTRSSDVYVAEQAFVIEEHQPVASLEDVELIVDCGANIGCTSAYLLSRYPRARLVAIEPDPANYDLLVRNLAAYGDRATCYRAAIWSSARASVTVSRGSFRDGLDWSTIVRETGSAGDTSVLSLDEVVDLHATPGRGIDLLKVDIEGAEVHLLGEGSARWAKSLRNLCIELHGVECEQALHQFLDFFECSVSTHDELTICLNLRRSHQALGPTIAQN